MGQLQPAFAGERLAALGLLSGVFFVARRIGMPKTTRLGVTTVAPVKVRSAFGVTSVRGAALTGVAATDAEVGEDVDVPRETRPARTANRKRTRR